MTEPSHSIFDARADALRLRLLKPWNFKVYLWRKLPLAACAGLSLRQLDASGCAVGLPGGWRTQNPFRSTYFAAQAMAAEMSTGAPAMILAQGAPASIAMILRGLEAVFTKRVEAAHQLLETDKIQLRAFFHIRRVGERRECGGLRHRVDVERLAHAVEHVGDRDVHQTIADP